MHYTYIYACIVLLLSVISSISSAEVYSNKHYGFDYSSIKSTNVHMHNDKLHVLTVPPLHISDGSGTLDLSLYPTAYPTLAPSIHHSSSPTTVSHESISARSHLRVPLHSVVLPVLIVSVVGMVVCFYFCNREWNICKKPRNLMYYEEEFSATLTDEEVAAGTSGGSFPLRILDVQRYRSKMGSPAQFANKLYVSGTDRIEGLAAAVSSPFKHRGSRLDDSKSDVILQDDVKESCKRTRSDGNISKFSSSYTVDAVEPPVYNQRTEDAIPMVVPTYDCDSDDGITDIF
mmetsp:Transcript_8566/g.12790  ORF Transcript_8566/g.12790 Transcript_8566/m.12790 type:complete len:288 (+) Transcript_8566:92-955(+)